MTLEVRLLGPPTALVDGRPIELDTRKALALLAFLVAARRPQTRDRLAELLYPEYDDERARGALRRTLSSLRKGLGDRWLVATRSTVVLEDAGAIDADVNRVRDALEFARSHDHHDAACSDCLEALRGAAEVAQGDFMAGFALRDSATFEDWQLAEGEAVRGEVMEVLDRLSEAFVAAGRPDEALDVAQRRVGLDPLSEAAHRRIMRLRAARGDRAGALRQYRHCVAVLDRELGVPPLEETSQLYADITEGRFVPEPLEMPVPAAPPAPAPAKPRRYSLVGREGELAAARAELERAGVGGRVVAIEGEAGIGKTRLVQELVSVLSTGKVIVGRAFEGERSVAYGVVVQCLRGLFADAESWPEQVGSARRPEIARLLPDLSTEGRTSFSEEADEAAHARLLDAVASTLGEHAELLVLEDVQWADEASLEVFAYLARRISGYPVRMLLTWRSEELDELHPVRRLAIENGRVVRLGRLPEDSVRQLVTEAHGGDLGVEIAARLVRETEGLPFFIVEYLSAVRGEAQWDLPGGVRALLSRRLASVSDSARQLVDAASVLGRSFDFDTVVAASGRDELEAVGALEELIARHLLESNASSSTARESYDFTHEKLRSFAYEELSPARRRLLHRRVAEALDVRARRVGEVGAEARVIAGHLEAAGDHERAAALYVRAAEHARDLYANEEALRSYERALALGYPETWHLHESMGDLLTVVGAYGRALTSFETAAALAPPNAVAAVECKLGSVHERRGDFELAESHMRAALDEEETLDRSARSGLYAELSLVRYRRGDEDDARRLAVRALEEAVAIADDEARARAENILGILAAARGDLEEAEKHLEESASRVENLGDPAQRVAALNNLALVARRKRDLSRSLELTRAALELCRRRGDRHRQAALHNNLADLLHARGDAQGAMKELKEAARLFAEVGDEGGSMRAAIWQLVEW